MAPPQSQLFFMIFSPWWTPQMGKFQFSDRKKRISTSRGQTWGPKDPVGPHGGPQGPQGAHGAPCSPILPHPPRGWFLILGAGGKRSSNFLLNNTPTAWVSSLGCGIGPRRGNMAARAPWIPVGPMGHLVPMGPKGPWAKSVPTGGEIA